MSKYAKIVDEKVVDIIMADEKFFETFTDTSAGRWVKVEDNQNACIGGFYDIEKNCFLLDLYSQVGLGTKIQMNLIHLKQNQQIV